jgi:hypothetical protein
MRARWLLAAVAAVTLAAAPGRALAHRPSDAFVRAQLAGATASVRLDLPVRDLADALALDGDRDGAVAAGEVASAADRIDDYLRARLAVRGDGRACPLAPARPLHVTTRLDVVYLVAELTAACAAPPSELALEYQILFELDATHVALADLAAGGNHVPGVLRDGARTIALAVDRPSVFARMSGFVCQGVIHIWLGLDHVLFLLALLLPAVLVRRGDRWEGAPSLRPVLVAVLRVVTGFTAAHSLTLALSALAVLELPPRFVESAIALSVLFAAVANLRGWVPRPFETAFALGLLHGFGFSSVLGELGLGHGDLVVPLVGFNVGVEVGQAAIVAVFVPIAYRLRDRACYRRFVLTGGSLAIGALSLVWAVERITG